VSDGPRAFPPGVHLVAGGAGAIGSAIGRRLRERGAERVLVCDVAAERAEAVAAQIGAEAAVLDVADQASVEALAGRLRADGTPVAGIVNCAAVFGSASFPGIGWDAWQRTLSVNLVGPYQLMVSLLDLMERDSAIVNVTSVEAFHVLNTGGGSTTDYAASKGGLQMLTKAVATDLAPRGIRVNAVAPGYIETAMNAAVLGAGDRRRFIEERIPLEGRIGCPDDIAGPVAFLLSHDAAYVTGTTLVVDGGLTLGTTRRLDVAS
jgi:NAD(P)-dependent dehydrogenase (short-subunit alcohol dehydrogenase family)